MECIQRAPAGRPHHPATLLKIYIYGYLNRIQSSRRLERETHANVELIWLTTRLSSDFKTIADFRRSNGRVIRRACGQLIMLCRRLNLFSEAIVAIDGSKFKAVNNRDKNLTDRKLEARMERLGENIARYLAELGRADRNPDAVTRGRIVPAQVPAQAEDCRDQSPGATARQELEDSLRTYPTIRSTYRPGAHSMAASGRGTGIVAVADFAGHSDIGVREA
jgi:transposase